MTTATTMTVLISRRAKPQLQARGGSIIIQIRSLYIGVYPYRGIPLGSPSVSPGHLSPVKAVCFGPRMPCHGVPHQEKHVSCCAIPPCHAVPCQEKSVPCRAKTHPMYLKHTKMHFSSQGHVPKIPKSQKSNNSEYNDVVRTQACIPKIQKKIQE